MSHQDDFFSILQGFAALTLTKYLEWPTCASVDAIQDFLIDQLISSDYFRLYPPSESYQKSFWKWVIGTIEERGEEVREEIYALYLALLEKSSTEIIPRVKTPTPSYVTYVWRDPIQGPLGRNPEMKLGNFRKCTLLEARTIIESGTTGLRTWTASFVLAEYLMSNKHILKSSRILELGSGAGFLGIVLARFQLENLDGSSGSSSSDRARPFLYLTDLDEQVLRRCESNVKLPCNNLLSHPDLHFKLLDWTDALDDTRRDDLAKFFKGTNVDLILGADLVYDASIVSALVATLRLSLSADPNPMNQPKKQALIAATVRNEDTLRVFVDKVQEVNLGIEEIEVGQDSVSSSFLRNQPDVLGESRSCVKLFLITNKVADS